MEVIKRSMRTLAYSARVRIADERTVEEAVQDTMDRMVYKPVAYARLVDVTRFRITDLEVVIWPVAIHSIA
jgi:hypothetical protein